MQNVATKTTRKAQVRSCLMTSSLETKWVYSQGKQEKIEEKRISGEANDVNKQAIRTYI